MRCLIPILLFILVGAFGHAGDGQIEIGPTDSFPIVIDQSGSYLLTSDLVVSSTTANAFEITVDEVTLDLGGHVLRGPGPDVATGSGIYANNTRNITVRNGTVTGFKYGIFQDSVSDTEGGGNRFFDLTVGHCDYSALRLKHAMVRDCAVHNSSVGLGCEFCTAANVQANNNTLGFELIDSSAVNCTATYNDQGFQIARTVLTACTSSFNSSHGIYAHYGSVLVGCAVVENGGWGIHASSGGSNVVNCVGAANTSGNIDYCGPYGGCHQNYLP